MSRLPAQVIASRCTICLGKFIIGLSPPANGKRRKGSRKSPSRFVRKADDTNAVLSNLSEELLKRWATGSTPRNACAPRSGGLQTAEAAGQPFEMGAVWKRPSLRSGFLEPQGRHERHPFESQRRATQALGKPGSTPRNTCAPR